MLQSTRPSLPRTFHEQTHLQKIQIDLPLKRDQHPMFSLGWNIFHVIDEDSPLYQQSADDLKRQQARLVLSIYGVDETINQTIRTRHVYSADRIRLNHRYKDISVFEGSSISYLDYNLFNAIEVEDINSEGRCEKFPVDLPYRLSRLRKKNIPTNCFRNFPRF